MVAKVEGWEVWLILGGDEVFRVGVLGGGTSSDAVSYHRPLVVRLRHLACQTSRASGCRAATA